MSELSVEKYGAFGRFRIRERVNKAGITQYVIHDANWMTDDDIRDGKSSPAVAIFHFPQIARLWCDAVESGKAVAIPFREEYESWPSLKKRVETYLEDQHSRKRASASRRKPKS